MQIVEFAPKLRNSDAARVLKEFYGLSGEISSLPSERDQNFRLKADPGEYVLKIANPAEDFDFLDAQNKAMDFVSSKTNLLPKVHPSLNGNQIEKITHSGQSHLVRLLDYLPGTPLGNVKRRSPALMTDLGGKLGELENALQGFDHPALHRKFHWDFTGGIEIVHEYRKSIRDPKLRKMVASLTEVFDEYSQHLLPRLRKGAIYNDANDYNVLVGGGTDIYTRNQTVTGFIDLGDMVHGYIIGDLGIAIAYAILDQPQPLITAGEILKGFNTTYKLKEEEISAFFGFICLRLCMSVCIAAEQQKREPKNEYLGISQIPIRNTLPLLTKIHPRFAEAYFRQVCGFPSRSSHIVRWLKRDRKNFAQIIPSNLKKRAAFLDLSIGSPFLNGNPEGNDEPKLSGQINEFMKRNNAEVAVGLYNEARYLYTSPAFSTGAGPTAEKRTIHLGIDLFAEPGTHIHAPLGGIVHALADNKKYQDYGPVIVLEHLTDDGSKFYTLYGHLSRNSLKLKPGQRIRKGQRFAEIGNSDVNGGWTPHLHFQLITDLLDLDYDFPGVASPSLRETYLGLCPDPNLILNIPPKAFPAPAPNKQETLSKRLALLGPSLSISYRSPVKVVRGWKQYLFDEEGRKYIDAYNNVAHVGHCHPRVVEAACQQINTLNTNLRYLHDNVNRYAERLTSLLPKPLDVCYFVNSASEANELALRLSRTFTQQKDMIVLEAAYHGNTTSLIDISPYKHNGPGGTGAPNWVHSVPIPDVFRGEFKSDDPDAGKKYAAYVDRAIQKIQKQGHGVAGFIAESLPSVGGQIVFPKGYLQDVYLYIREAGGLCIADEVQTGFGRVGSHLWGFEMQDVVPDIVVLGKPIGNGHPLAAVITRRDVADAFHNGMEYFTTFGGNPVSCAVGLAVLDVLEEEKLQEHAHRVGTKLLNGLKSFVGKYNMVADARGAGLFLGVEMVRDMATLEPAAEEASFISNRMREHGILLGTDGPFHNVVKIRPPMPFDEKDAEYLLEVFEKILQDDFGKIE